jgi:conjugative relaxase-like TrwC/TraI family protein
MMNARSVHSGHAREDAKYLYGDAVSLELTTLDAVLAAANGYPHQSVELLGIEGTARLLATVTDGSFVEAFPVRFRSDLSKRLENVLKVDREIAPDMETVCRVLMGRDSEGGLLPHKRYAPVERKDGAQQQAFLHVTFSAGKSVSVAWQLAQERLEAGDTGGKALRNGIRRSQFRAVEATLRAMEPILGSLRTGHAGGGPREAGDLAWVTFFHTSSRSGDPQLHTHVAILNLVASRETPRLGGLDTRALQGQFTHFRAIYQQNLATNLKNIGLDVRYDHEKLEAIIDGISEHLIERHSQRKHMSLAYARARNPDFDNLPMKARNGEMKRAVFATRPEKQVTEMGVGDWTEHVPPNFGHHVAELGRPQSEARRQHGRTGLLGAPERRALGLRMPDGGYHVGGERDLDWGLTR